MHKRIVVKVGTKVMTEDGRLSEAVLQGIVDQVAALKKQGMDVIVITSGAVATGKGLLGQTPSDSVAQRQVFAAVGQVGLMTLYAKLFEKYGYRCAQVLVTKGDFRDKQHYANMQNCFENLLQENIVPIVNENDTVSISELVFTDNDELAGLIASQLNVDAVVFLTSVDGVMTGSGSVVPEIREEDMGSFEADINDTKSAGGRGGMKTKFTIAKRLMAHGITVHIANGARANIVLDVAEGKPVGTTFVPTKKISAVKRRLAYSEGLAVGTVYVDKGAEKILTAKKSASLLPVGVVRLEGAFKKGETVEIRSEDGRKLGFGVAQYDASEAASQIGRKGGHALIHYNSMVID